MISKEKRQTVYDMYDGKCAYCGCHLNATHFTIDHIIPKAYGGTNDISNLLPACHNCNKMKNDLSVESFRRAIALLNNKYQNWGGEFYFEKCDTLIIDGVRFYRD